MHNSPTLSSFQTSNNLSSLSSNVLHLHLHPPQINGWTTTNFKGNWKQLVGRNSWVNSPYSSQWATALSEIIVDFKNLKDKSFNLTETLNVQGWNTFFDRLTCQVYPVLLKQFWVHATTERETITSYVMNRKIVTTDTSIADLIGYDGKGKRVHSATITAKRDADISPIIFKEETNFADEKGPSTKDLTRNPIVWFKIILGCINHRTSTNRFDYIKDCHHFCSSS